MSEDFLSPEIFGRKELAQAQKDKSRLKIRVSLDKIRHKLDTLFGRKNKRELVSQFDLSEKFELTNEEFEQLRVEVENPQDHERIARLMSKTVQNIQDKLPWIKTYPESQQRLLRARSRFVAVDSKTMNLLDHAYMDHPLITEFREGKWDVSDAKSLAYYTPCGDFIVVLYQLIWMNLYKDPMI